MSLTEASQQAHAAAAVVDEVLQGIAFAREKIAEARRMIEDLDPDRFSSVLITARGQLEAGDDKIEQSIEALTWAKEGLEIWTPQ